MISTTQVATTRDGEAVDRDTVSRTISVLVLQDKVCNLPAYIGFLGHPALRGAAARGVPWFEHAQGLCLAVHRCCGKSGCVHTLASMLRACSNVLGDAHYMVPCLSQGLGYFVWWLWRLHLLLDAIHWGFSQRGLHRKMWAGKVLAALCSLSSLPQQTPVDGCSEAM